MVQRMINYVSLTPHPQRKPDVAIELSEKETLKPHY